MKTILHLTVLIFAITTAASSSEVQVTTLEASPGMLPFKLGKSRLITSEHTFVHYVPLDLIRAEISQLYSIYGKLNDFSFGNKTTTQLKFSNTYLNSHQYLGSMLQTIVNKFANIDQTSHDSRDYHTQTIRNKRGLFNFIGKINKWVTGTLDSEDGKRYDKAIEILQNHDYDVVTGYNKMISLSRHLTDNYRKTIETISKNQIEIKNYFNNLDEKLIKVQNDLYTYFSYTTTMDKLQITANMILSLLNNLENVIMFSKMHLLHPDIISINELKTNIAMLTETYYKDSVLPISYHAWYDVIKTHSYYQNSRLIIALDVPVVLGDTFDLYHIYPVPSPNNTILIPSKPLLALNQKHYQYMETPCEQIENINICLQQQLLYNPEQECIPAFLLGLPAHCDPVPIHQPGTLIEAINNEYTILYTKERTKLKTRCNGEINIQVIQGSALIRTPLNCSLTFRDFNLTHLQTEFKGHPFILPTIDIRIERKRELPLSKLHIDNIPLDDIHKIYKEANALKPIHLESFDYSTPIDWSLLSIIIIIIILILCFLSFKCFRAYKKKTTTPTVQVNLETLQGPPSRPSPSANPNLTPSLVPPSNRPKVPF